MKLVGTHACTTSDGAPSSIRAGWHVGISCKCDNSKQFLDCDGPPSTGEMLANGDFTRILEKERARFSVQVGGRRSAREARHSTVFLFPSTRGEE